MSKKMGRPTMPEGQGKQVLVALRVTQEEKLHLEAFAKEETKTFSAWAREILLTASKKKK